RTEVFNCIEGLIETSFTILPGFPYPIGNNYINCFPYNSDLLTTEEKEECIYNPLREGTENNKGCLLITENIMDNYYCCE
ncbi:MAG: hypothetical protein PHG37_03615, partial [Candidatus Pacebacteria bacterium]|nr:hypothetical protein [Candidatus Paceibacterota bacterium]